MLLSDARDVLTITTCACGVLCLHIAQLVSNNVLFIVYAHTRLHELKSVSKRQLCHATCFTSQSLFLVAVL